MADVRLLTWGLTGVGVSFTNHTVDTSTDGIAWIVQAEEAATITRIGWRQGAVTGTSPVFIGAIESRATNGEPDGTVLGGGSPASATFTPVGGGDGTWQWLTLDNTLAVTRGQILAITIRYSSGTIDGSNNCSFTRRMAGHDSDLTSMPYVATLAGGSWSIQDDYPCWGMSSASKSYGNPAESATTVNIDDASTPDEIGLAFTVPSGATTNFEVAGLFGEFTWPDLGASALTATLYSDTTALQSIAITGRVGSTAVEHSTILFDESSLTSLTPGTEYIIAIKNSHATTNATLRTTSFDSASENSIGIWGPSGLSPQYATRTDSGAWTLDDARIVHLVPIIKSLTATGGGGGGGVKQAGASGGMVG